MVEWMDGERERQRQADRDRSTDKQTDSKPPKIKRYNTNTVVTCLNIIEYLKVAKKIKLLQFHNHCESPFLAFT